jgi:hypothetical protein
MAFLSVLIFLLYPQTYPNQESLRSQQYENVPKKPTNAYCIVVRFYYELLVVSELILKDDFCPSLGVIPLIVIKHHLFLLFPLPYIAVSFHYQLLAEAVFN